MKGLMRSRKIGRVVGAFSLIFFMGIGGISAQVSDGAARSLTLEEAIDMALAQNPDLALAELALEDARTREEQARSASDAIPTDAVSSLETAKIKELLPRQALMGVRLAEKGLETARDNLKLGVEQAYFGVQLARDLEEVRRQAVTLAENQLRQAEVGYQAGVRARTDMLAAQTQLAAARADLATAEKGRAVAEMELNQVLGLPLTEKLELTTPLEVKDAAVGAADLTAVILKARERSSAVLTAREEEETARLERDMTGRYYTPNVYSYRLAETNWRSKEAGLRKALVASELEVRKALLDIEEARRVMEQRTKAVSLSEENMRLADLRYQAGVGTSTEVLDNQIRLNGARVNLANAVHALRMALLRYDHLVGEAG